MLPKIADNFDANGVRVSKVDVTASMLPPIVWQSYQPGLQQLFFDHTLSEAPFALWARASIEGAHRARPQINIGDAVGTYSTIQAGDDAGDVQQGRANPQHQALIKASSGLILAMLHSENSPVFLRDIISQMNDGTQWQDFYVIVTSHGVIFTSHCPGQDAKGDIGKKLRVFLPALESNHARIANHASMQHVLQAILLSKAHWATNRSDFDAETIATRATLHPPIHGSDQ